MDHSADQLLSGKHRLLWITERYPPAKGGMAVSCQRIVSGLRQRNIDLDVIAVSNLSETEWLTTVERDGGIDLHIRRAASPGVIAQLAWAQLQLRNTERPYTAVVGFGANLPGFIASSFAAWLNLPCLVLVRGNDFDRDWFDARRGFWVREALSRADIVGVVSPEKIAKIQSLFPGKKVIWTPNGIDAPRWRLLPTEQKRSEEIRRELGEDGKRIIGMFGELKFKKRAPLWLAALRDSGWIHKVALLLVGRVDDETQQILADPSLAPYNRQISFCKQEELSSYYAACNYVALPSLFEGMPNVLLEAMACGAVPIASSAGAMPFIIEDGKTGFLFAPEDRAAAARAAVRALSLSPEELRQMSAAAKSHIENSFSMEREFGVYVDILANLPDKINNF